MAVAKRGKRAAGKALAVVYRPTGKLKPAERNARTHSDAQVQQLVASITEFGWTSPILLDENGLVLAGHGRLAAAKALALAEVPTITLTGLSDAQKRAVAIADNKLALNADWDLDILRAELDRLDHEDGFRMPLLGFSPEEFDTLFAPPVNAGRTDADAVSVPPEHPTTVLGDVWLLGRHRLVCGDSTDADTVAKALGGAKPHLMVTDPPYGVEYDPDWRNRADRANGKPCGARAVGRVENDERADWSEAYSLFPGDVAYVWHAGRHASEVQASLEASGFEIRCQLIWAKQQFVIGRGHYHWKHEPCWYAVREGATGRWSGDRTQTTLWEIDKPIKSETGHGTQKPVECMRRPIENNSKPGDAVYEPFSGSGTTIIAAEMTGRACHAIELSPAYVDVAVKRWQDFTGEAATLEADGRTFAATAKRR